MSDEREAIASRVARDPENATSPGAPIEETEASRTEVLRAVERSKASGPEADGSAASEAGVDAGIETGAAARTDALGVSPADGSSEAIPASEPASQPSSASESTAFPVSDRGVAADADAAAIERAHREEMSLLDTQLDLEAPTSTRPGLASPASPELTSALPALDELPSAGVDAPERPARDGEIRISPDHPMAGLYMQSPIPPDIKGNRGAGVLISIVATVGFALVFAGVLALWLAPMFPASTFIAEAFIPWMTSWPVIAAVVAFFVGLVLIVLIVGRAGWWAYVLGGFVVAALVWAAVTLALAFFGTPFETPREMLGGARAWSGDLHTLVTRFGLTVPALGAALVAREATVWFGAWIGARGRRMKLRNAREIADYEAALAESKAEPRP